MAKGHIALGWVQDLRVERPRKLVVGSDGKRRVKQSWGGWAADSASDFLDDLELGSRVARHKRTWIVGPNGYQDVDVWGRIGFVAQGDAQEVWDEVTQDFRPVDSERGASAPFTVNRATGRLSFQFRPGLIERTAYTAALEALANRTVVARNEKPRWRVWPDIGEMTWQEWVERAGAVDRLSFRIELPNPNWAGRQDLENIVENSRTTLLELVYSTDDPAGLDLNDALIRQAIDHTVERGYGAARATSSRTRVPKFDSEKKRVPAAEVEVELEEGRKDVGPETLRGVAAEHAESTQPEPPKRRLASPRKKKPPAEAKKKRPSGKSSGRSARGSA